MLDRIVIGDKSALLYLVFWGTKCSNNFEERYNKGKCVK
jgi:hypothetical protein